MKSPAHLGYPRGGWLDWHSVMKRYGRVAQVGQVSGRLLRRLATNATVFHYARIPAYWGTLDRVRRALDLRDGESLLDLGCGTGFGTALARGLYAGIDTERELLPLARCQVLGRPHLVAVMSATALGFVDATFDKAVLMNMVHHLDEPSVDQVMSQLRRVVRGPVVVLEPAPDSANRISRFLLTHDRGRYVRSRDQLCAVLERRYRIAAEETFHNTLRIVSQILFTLVPLGDLAHSEHIAGLYDDGCARDTIA